MLSLITVILSIALMAAFLLISVNYVRPWFTGANNTYTFVTQGFPKLEAAFNVTSKAANGVSPPPITSNVDGGLAANFGASLAFLPQAPPGYAWAYGGTNAATLSSEGYAGFIPPGGLLWFCLYPAVGGAGSEGTIHGLFRAKNYLAPTQYYVTAGNGSACGNAINSAPPGGYPANYVATYFVRYVPTP